MKIEELRAEKCFEILKRSDLGRLACSNNDQPYIVPFNFAYEMGDYLYAFATVGKKIEWMRRNPLVCIEVEEIKERFDWTTLVIFGRYEELPDEPQFKKLRMHAHELLSRRPMWWQPAFVAGARPAEIEQIPVYFRIFIENITGHRGYTEKIESFLPVEKLAREDKTWRHGMW